MGKILFWGFRGKRDQNGPKLGFASFMKNWQSQLFYIGLNLTWKYFSAQNELFQFLSFYIDLWNFWSFFFCLYLFFIVNIKIVGIFVHIG